MPLDYLRRYFPLLLLFVAASNAGAQIPDVSFRYLDFRDGLPEYCEPLALVQDKFGRLWYGTDKGLFLYDGYAVTNFPADIHDSTSLSELYVQALYVHEDSTVWVGTRNMGICIYQPSTGRFIRAIPKEEGGTFPVRRVRSFFRDRDGDIWIGCDEGLVRCRPDKMQFDHFPIYDHTLSEVEVEYINTLRQISEDPLDQNILWICTRAGLLSFDKITKTFHRHSMPFKSSEVGLKDFDYMLISMVWTTHEDIWFGSWAGGIMHYNTSTRNWSRYRLPEADPLYEIHYQLRSRDDHEFWYTGYQYCGVFDRMDQSFTSFKKRNEQPGGLLAGPSYESMLVTHDGILVIGGNNGLSFSVEPVSPVDPLIDFRPIITSIESNHNAVRTDTSVTKLKSLRLNADDGTLTFTYSWPMYYEFSSVAFRFKLDGYDSKWNDNGQARRVQYTNLRPGKYRFLYEASKDGQDWVRGSTSPLIIIQGPFYSKTWFIAAVITFFGALLGFIYMMRIRQIRWESQLKTEFNRKMAENEMTALRAQMNPHFMFNSLNSIKNYILKENTSEASKYLTKFSQLMRAILKNSRHKLITLEDELLALRLYIEMESMRFNSEFDHTISIAPDINPAALFIPPLLIQPYVENAIWHGLMLKEGERLLSLKIGSDGDRLLIVVEDNGVGRERAQTLKASENGHGKSFGMRITKDRIDLINRTLGINAEVSVEDLYDPQGEPCGTRVCIYVPVITEEVFAKT